MNPYKAASQLYANDPDKMLHVNECILMSRNVYLPNRVRHALCYYLQFIQDESKYDMLLVQKIAPSTLAEVFEMRRVIFHQRRTGQFLSRQGTTNALLLTRYCQIKYAIERGLTPVESLSPAQCDSYISSCGGAMPNPYQTLIRPIKWN